MRRSPTVYILFLLSGISALMYEIVWGRMLALVFGHTVFSVAVVLAAFMAGLGLGSYLWGGSIDRWKNPLLVYGKIEILISVSCLALSLLFAHFAAVYSWLAFWLPEHPAVQNLTKTVLAFLLMMPPTTLMGATLPVISKYFVTNDPKLGSQVGYLYAINTLGAVCGGVLTGFVLISAFGMLQTLLLASAINLFAGVGALRIYQEAGDGPPVDYKFPWPAWRPIEWSPRGKLWVTVSFVSGFTALAYEVIWTRLLVFSIAGTVYSFSMMLAVFLLGIALGSLLAVPLLKRCADLRAALVFLQAGIGLSVLVTLYLVNDILSPPWNSYNLQEPVRVFLRYFKDSAALMLAPTLFFGASFPILTKILAGDHSHVGRGTGQNYAFNTLGAILGSLVAGFLLLPALGSQNSLMALAVVNMLAAILLFGSGNYLTAPARRGLALVLAGVVLTLPAAVPGGLLDHFFMRDSVGKRDSKKLLYFNEGLTVTVAVFRDNYGILDPEAKRLVTNGISMSASNKVASRYMKLFAHVPVLLAEQQPEEVLVICFGTGQTAGAAAVHPSVRSVEALDLSPGVVHSGTVFARENHAVLDNPKVKVILQDGRNHLLVTRKQYDVITAEPPPPRTAFTVNLYTREYYELTRKRLKPGGIVAQWVPLHSQSEKEVLMHFRTFHDVFPYVMGWMSVANEILLIGSDRPIVPDVQKIKRRLQDPGVRRALADIEIHNVYSFLGNIWFLEDQIEKLSAGQPAITDNRPSIEFYLQFPGAIQTAGLEKFVFNRAPFEEVAHRIANLTEDGRKRLKAYYEAMDFYQRGVMYGNNKILLEAVARVEDNNLFRYHLQAGEEQMARLQRRAADDPNNAEALLNLGHAFFQLGKYEESLKALRQVGGTDPRKNLGNVYMGYDYMEMGQRTKAKSYFESAVRENPRLMRSMMQEIALIDLLNKLEEDPENPGLANAAAQFFNMKNDFAKSLKFSLAVLAEHPMDRQALKNIIFSYRGLGEPGEVLAYGIQYEMLDPDDTQFHYIMAEMYAKTLRCDKAVPYLEKILQKDDTYRGARQLLERCREDAVVRQSGGRVAGRASLPATETNG
ncbi:MAG: fused MFS/spermidine synthase [Nitrospinales bacterium]